MLGHLLEPVKALTIGVSERNEENREQTSKRGSAEGSDCINETKVLASPVSQTDFVGFGTVRIVLLFPVGTMECSPPRIPLELMTTSNPFVLSLVVRFHLFNWLETYLARRSAASLLPAMFQWVSFGL